MNQAAFRASPILKLISVVSLLRPTVDRVLISGDKAAISDSTARNLGCENVVDLIEVGFELRQLIARADLSAGDTEVEVDVRVHTRQQMLQDQPAVIAAGFEGQFPAVTWRSARLVRRQRIEVARCKHHIQPFHQGTVLEASALTPSRTASVTRR